MRGFLIGGGLWVAVAMIPVAAWAQQPPEAGGAAPTPAETAALLQGIQQQLQQISGRLQRLEGTAGVQPTLVRPAPLPVSGVTREQLDAEVNRLDGRITALARDLLEVSYGLEQVVRQGPSGWELQLRSAMEKNPANRSDLASAVKMALPKTGTVELVNEMASSQQVRINGVVHNVPAQTMLVVDNVPVGTVTTELIGFESPKNWTLSAPGFNQRIRIAPRVVENTWVYDPWLGWVIAPRP